MQTDVEKSGTSPDTVTVCTNKLPLGVVTNNDARAIPSLSEMEPIAKQESKERAMTPDEILFIAIAWVVISAFRFFMFCPEVIWCDVTSHSNNKDFHLLNILVPDLWCLCGCGYQINRDSVSAGFSSMPSQI